MPAPDPRNPPHEPQKAGSTASSPRPFVHRPPILFSVLDRYLFTQLINPFLFGFFLFVIVIAIDPLMTALQYVINDGISATVVARWFLAKLPQDMVFTFPMSVLLSTLLVFGRMSKDSETIALRAGGINFLRLLLPVLAFALMITLISFAFNELVVPSSNERAHRIQREEIMRLLEPEATENALLRSVDGAFIYARKVYERTGTMEKVMVERYDDNRLVQRTTGAEAVWDGRRWTLLAAIDQYYGPDGEMTQHLIPKLVLETVPETPTEFARKAKRSNQMSYRELEELIESYERSRFVDTLPLQVDLASKVSLPFASFFFALVGASFGLTNYRSGAFIGFGLSVMIIFIYYVLMSFSTAMGKSGYLPVVLSAWLQNLIFLGVSLVLVLRVNR